MYVSIKANKIYVQEAQILLTNLLTRGIEVNIIFTENKNGRR